MGPRSVERGKVPEAPWERGQNYASMGPRSVERGKRFAIRTCTEPTTSFNGAAFC
mgnify:CR=1 FL=1